MGVKHAQETQAAADSPPEQRPQWLDVVRRDAGARDMVRRWREHTGGSAPTLVACSGGVDSCALLLALRAARAPLVVAHVVHDLRPPETAHADRDFVRSLADSLGLDLVIDEVHVRADRDNLEAAARRARYRALERIARRAGLRFVATAHHADDQFESIVMALLRGAAPAALAGVAPRRALAEGVTLIRPMLGLVREDAVRLCRAAGVQWREDATNQDRSRTRSALRLGPLRDIAALRPGSAKRAARAADLLRDAARLVEERVHSVFADRLEWDRDRLALETTLVLGAGLRRAALRIASHAADPAGADRLGARAVDPVIRAIRDHATHTRVFTWPVGDGVHLHVRARTVTASRSRSSPPPSTS